jgi:hypothetical protein
LIVWYRKSNILKKYFLIKKILKKYNFKKIFFTLKSSKMFFEKSIHEKKNTGYKRKQARL